MNQSERPGAQGDSAVAWSALPRPFWGEAGHRKAPCGIRGQAGRSRQTHPLHKPGVGLCSVPGPGRGPGEAACSHMPGWQK